MSVDLNEYQANAVYGKGCGAMSIGRTDNMYQLWGILVLAGLGIGGIVVPASIITTIICPDVSVPR